MDLGKYQNSIQDLPKLNNQRYENIFKMYDLKTGQHYYNLLRSIHFPDNIDNTQITYITVKQSLPWTAISFNVYQTIELWWLICLLNKIDNPIKAPAIGTILKVLNPYAVKNVLNEISNNLK
jgi:hypothetical protein